MDILRWAMHLGSFWTLWYWIAHAVTWSLVSHFALGVPYDAVIQANREKDEDGPWSRAVEGLIRAQVYRLSFFYRQYGVFLVGASSFLLAMLATLGFYVDVELARAVLCILAPLTLVYGVSLRTALRMEAEALSGQALRNAVRSQRFWNQLIGVLAIILAMGMAMWEYLRGIAPIWN